MKIDLHTHSTASDGQYTPSELASLVHKKSIELWALTDHDTIDGIGEARSTAKAHGISFIPGIEISTQDVEEIHILGHYIDANNLELINRCAEYQEARLGRGVRIRDYLKTKGINVDLDEVRSFAKGSTLGRPHFAEYLVEHEYVDDRKAAFDIYLDTDEFKQATDRHKPSPEEIIELIHYAGGMATLAHPGNYRMDENELTKLVKRLCDAGLDGIECIYSRHTPEQTLLYLDLAHRYDLKISCGSDFHGEKVKSDILLGMSIEEAEDNYIWNLGP